MSFLELAKKRYSVRSYKEAPVEREKLDQILGAGRVAPTGANKQPQRLIVVQSKEGLEKGGQSRTFLWRAVCHHRMQRYGETWKRPYDGKKLTDIDASIVTDHMMMQATELGLGTLWICWFDPGVLRAEFDIPGILRL